MPTRQSGVSPELFLRVTCTYVRARAAVPSGSRGRPVLCHSFLAPQAVSRAPAFSTGTQGSAVHIYLNVTCRVCVLTPRCRAGSLHLPDPGLLVRLHPGEALAAATGASSAPGQGTVPAAGGMPWPFLQGGSGSGLLGAGHPSVLGDVSCLSPPALPAF